jgi:translation initiation factor 2B subunit (eIF-2B alpha/beta/delta family)
MGLDERRGGGAPRRAGLAALTDARLRAIADDRVHGAGWLARRALGVLAGSPTDHWPALAAEVAELRPEMPALAAAAREALAAGDVREVLRRADAERRAVAAAAAERLRGVDVVATISNSSLVARALVLARPPRVEVVVEDDRDEGHLLLAELAATGIAGAAVERPRADLAVVGCDAVFDDGGFVNRRGTARLARSVARVLVLTERWKLVGGPTPTTWPVPDLFEVVPPDPRVALIGPAQ